MDSCESVRERSLIAQNRNGKDAREIKLNGDARTIHSIDSIVFLFFFHGKAIQFRFLPSFSAQHEMYIHTRSKWRSGSEV